MRGEKILDFVFGSALESRLGFLFLLWLIPVAIALEIIIRGQEREAKNALHTTTND